MPIDRIPKAVQPSGCIALLFAVFRDLFCFVLMGVELPALLLPVFAHLFIVGGVYYRIKM